MCCAFEWAKRSFYSTTPALDGGLALKVSGTKLSPQEYLKSINNESVEKEIVEYKKVGAQSFRNQTNVEHN